MSFDSEKELNKIQHPLFCFLIKYKKKFKIKKGES